MSSVGVMVSSHPDPILDSRILKPYLSSVGGSNACAMPIGYTFTSATALLQIAAKMGTKMSDNTITTKDLLVFPQSSFCSGTSLHGRS